MWGVAIYRGSRCEGCGHVCSLYIAIEVTQDVASRGVGVVKGCGHACSLYRGDPGGGISRYGRAV